MNEEEIILYLTHTAEDDFNLEEHQRHNRYLAIQGLLDLYNKEKQERINLEQELEKRQWVKVKENGEIEPAFYISKDKIKEKIEKLNKEMINADEIEAVFKIKQQQVLQELLKERN